MFMLGVGISILFFYIFGLLSQCKSIGAVVTSHVDTCYRESGKTPLQPSLEFDVPSVKTRLANVFSIYSRMH